MLDGDIYIYMMDNHSSSTFMTTFPVANNVEYCTWYSVVNVAST